MSPEVIGWYASIFFWLYFTGLGIPPCPEEAGILYAAGLTALHPEMHWWLSWPLTSAGILCADLTLYALGRFWGHRLVRLRWAHWVLSAERRQRLERRFHDHGVKLLIAARLLPPLRTGVFLIAGTIHYSFARFVAADGIFAVIGVGVLYFCSTWLIDLIHQVGSWVLWAAVPVALIYGLYRYYRYLRSRELRGEPTPPVSVLTLPIAPREEKSVADPVQSPGSSP
jgi:membrane protein DedA with SNARE-associated domain